MVVDAGQFLAGSVLPATIACPPRRVAGHPQGRNEVEEPRLRGLTRHPPRWLSSRRVPCKGLGRRGSPQAPRAGEDDEAWHRIDCSRISGLCVETPVSGPPWKSHTAGHTWRRRRAPGLLSAWCGVGRFEAPSRSFTHSAVAVVGCSRGEGNVPGPDGPHDPSQLVGYRERSLVVFVYRVDVMDVAEWGLRLRRVATT